MSLLIKGMDMPKSCFECRFYQNDMDYCEATGTDYPFLEEVKLKDCPLAETPTPHGRLIDADKLRACLNALEYIAYAEGGRPTFAEALEEIAKAPTIIEAEE